MEERRLETKEARKHRRFRNEWLAVSLVYVALGLGMIFLGGSSETADRVWRGAMLAGLLAMVSVQVRWHFRGDEWERSIDLRAAGVGFVTSLVVSAAFSFLGAESGQVQHAGFVILFAGFLAFSIGKLVLVRGLSA
ncbi:MAG: hypothetical protein AAF236_12825 [Verrucomicrobiota bacterium]